MRDFFTLFSQPRQPWLEPEALKEKHHQLTRLAHPDVRGSGASKNFEEINEGYRVLSEPKQRLEHLLELEGEPIPQRDESLPADLQDYFLQIATLRQQIQRVFTEMGEISSAIKLSLVKNDLLQFQKQTADLLGQLTSSYDDCLKGLRELNEVWKKSRNDAIPQLRVLHDRMAYLSRWIAQLKETETQFALRG